MPAEISPSHTNISDDANEPSSRDKNTEDMFPNFFKLIQENLIFLNMSHLSRMFIVALKIPIRRRGHDKMDRLIL